MFWYNVVKLKSKKKYREHSMLTMYSEGIYACFADIIKKDPPQSAKTSYQNKQTDGNEGGGGGKRVRL